MCLLYNFDENTRKMITIHNLISCCRYVDLSFWPEKRWTVWKTQLIFFSSYLSPFLCDFDLNTFMVTTVSQPSGVSSRPRVFSIQSLQIRACVPSKVSLASFQRKTRDTQRCLSHPLCLTHIWLSLRCFVSRLLCFRVPAQSGRPLLLEGVASVAIHPPNPPTSPCPPPATPGH